MHASHSIPLQAMKHASSATPRPDGSAPAAGLSPLAGRDASMIMMEWRRWARRECPPSHHMHVLSESCIYRNDIMMPLSTPPGLRRNGRLYLPGALWHGQGSRGAQQRGLGAYGVVCVHTCAAVHCSLTGARWPRPRATRGTAAQGHAGAGSSCLWPGRA